MSLRTVVVGGGPAALEAVLTLREVAPQIEVELLSADTTFVYRPLSVLEPFSAGEARTYPLERLSELGVHVRRGRLARVDADRRQVVTEDGDHLGYDALLVAAGARPRATVTGALTFAGLADVEAMHGLVQDLEGGYSRSIAFVAPHGATWTLPLYELALQAAERSADDNLRDVRLTITTPERRPLEVFGTAASELAEKLLGDAGIEFAPGTAPSAARVVALPRLEGSRTPGLPCDDDGFLPVDPFGRVHGADRVYGAGDGVDFPIKQGGLAAQQAAVAAQRIAADLGADIEPVPLNPVLRGMLIAGRSAWYMRRSLKGDPTGEVSTRALWWPPTKIAGERLAPFLDSLDGEEGAERRIEARGSKAKRRILIAPRGRRP